MLLGMHMNFTRFYRHCFLLLFLFIMPIHSQAAKTLTAQHLNDLLAHQAIAPDAAVTAAKPTLVKLWASWCPQCLAELADAQALANDTDLEGINILTLASPGILNEMPLDEFKTWFSGLKQDPQLPLLLDTKGQGVDTLGICASPRCALLDADGKFMRLIAGRLTNDQITTLMQR